MVLSTETHAHLAHIKLGDSEKVVPAGPTTVQQLKVELGVDPAEILYLVHGHASDALQDDQTIDVRSGMHFDAVPGGGVS